MLGYRAHTISFNFLPVVSLVTANLASIVLMYTLIVGRGMNYEARIIFRFSVILLLLSSFDKIFQKSGTVTLFELTLKFEFLESRKFSYHEKIETSVLRLGFQ